MGTAASVASFAHGAGVCDTQHLGRFPCRHPLAGPVHRRTCDVARRCRRCRPLRAAQSAVRDPRWGRGAGVSSRSAAMRTGGVEQEIDRRGRLPDLAQREPAPALRAGPGQRLAQRCQPGRQFGPQPLHHLDRLCRRGRPGLRRNRNGAIRHVSSSRRRRRRPGRRGRRSGGGCACGGRCGSRCGLGGRRAGRLASRRS